MNMAEIGAAIELGRAGQQAQARTALAELWDRIGPAGDVTERCTIAHFLADLQEAPDDELTWDERALATAREDESVTHGFFPSLHLNLADVHRRLGHTDLAREHLALAQSMLDRLAADEYGDIVRGGAVAVADALDAGSTARLV